MSFYFSSFFHRVNMLHGVSIVESSVDWTFFRWFVYKQIIFTENPSTQPHEMQQPHFISSLSSRTLVQFTSIIQSISLHIETLLLFLLLHEFIFEKHFDQLNSKCECHWIWHRWMISVQSKRINGETRKKRYLNGGKKHDSTFFFFGLFSFLRRLSWLLQRWKWTYGLCDWRSRDTMMTKKKCYMIWNSAVVCHIFRISLFFF